ncbi:MAG: RNA polymerase sigma factor [Chlorobi bacterium CHB2]|nr:RNA polymerase sigma factor [Chlorobi bacterium CHB2]
MLPTNFTNQRPAMNIADTCKLLSDAELLQQIVEKNMKAISELYDRYNRQLYALVLNIVKDDAEAEDILQEVFMQIWKKAPTYNRELGSPKTWLLRMTQNKAIDLIRSKRYQQKKQEAFSLDDQDEVGAAVGHSENSTWGAVMHQEQRTYLFEALRKLPIEQRHLIEKAFLEGYTHQELSDALAIPLGTIKTRIRTGMMALRKELAFLQEDYAL